MLGYSFEKKTVGATAFILFMCFQCDLSMGINIYDLMTLTLEFDSLKE